jgi:hypothetical protein
VRVEELHAQTGSTISARIAILHALGYLIGCEARLGLRGDSVKAQLSNSQRTNAETPNDQCPTSNAQGAPDLALQRWQLGVGHWRL